MDLSYGPEYEDFRAEVRAFLAEQWPPREAGGSRAEQAKRFREQAVARGYLLRWIPRRYGGSEQPQDALRAAILREEFSRARAPMEPRGIGMMMLVPTLLEKGSETQKQRFVPPTAAGDMHWCQGYSEPGSGSDLASLKTRAELVGSEWVIHGQKIWTTNAREADYMFCLCRTEPDAPKHAGISYLLVPMRQPGVEVRPLRQMNGGADFNEVFLTDARTPAENIVGARGEGWLVSRATLKHERDGIGNAAVSNMMFAGLVALAKQVTRNGRPAIQDPAIRQRLAALEGYVRSHEYSGYRQLSRGARGKEVGRVGTMNKLVSTNIGSEVAKLAIDLLGDGGLVDPMAQDESVGGTFAPARSWLSQYMYSLGIAIAGGTANIQRNVIGERGLGLPRDHYADRSSGPVNFDTSDEQELLQETLRRFLDGECPPKQLREIFDGDTGHDPALWKGLVELGIGGLAIPEAYGGAGLETIDLALAAETLGHAAAPGPFLGHALAAVALAAGGSDAQRRAWLPKLATGEATGSVAIGEPGGGWLPEQWTVAGGSRLTGAKSFVPCADLADVIVVGTAGGGLALVERGARGLAITPCEGVDRTRRLGGLALDGVAADPLANGAEAAARLRDVALVLCAADAFGAAVRLLDLCVAYAGTREQFGVTIAHFQALKHQLANMAVEIEPSRGLWWYAAHAIDHVPADAARYAALAKSHVTERAMQLARDAVEAHGGIGFTWECDVQIWFKRVLFDRAWMGTPEVHRERAATLAGW